jgi:hypothetical protein
MLNILADTATTGFSLESFVQLTGMGGFASILLWATLKKAQEQDKGLRSLSITLITIQQSLLVYTMSMRKKEESAADECIKLLAACEQLHRILEQQRIELEKQYASK